MDAFTGEIRLFSGNYSPKGWAICNGELLSIAQYPELFAVLGGYDDGRSHFALPDLRGRVPVGIGQGPGLPERSFRETGKEGTAGDNGVPFAALNFIICLNGTFPER